MAHTIALLALIDEFPEAFAAPDLNALGVGASVSTDQTATDQNAEDQDQDPLLALIEEFPSAFLSSEEGRAGAMGFARSLTIAHQSATDDANHDANTTEAEIMQVSPASEATDTSQLQGAIAPEGYELGLHKQVSTFAWGQIDVYLRYGQEGLASLWITVGKSGTEVQSLCEAIARLVNLLIQRSVPIPDIIKEIRGIRGGDSEGLGPHRFLGLVDLIGKIIQDAPVKIPSISVQPSDPTSLASAPLASAPLASAPLASTPLEKTLTEPASTPTSEYQGDAKVVAVSSSLESPDNSSSTHDATLLSNEWVTLANELASASICPDCGAELQQVNGCSGGACVVCGYSSCS